jgi:hypothetical protein
MAACLLGLLLGASHCGNPDEAAPPPAANFTRTKHQALSIASNPTLSGGATDLTIMAWINLASKTANEVIAAKDNDATKEGSEYWFGYEQHTDRLNFQVEDPYDGTMYVKANSFGSPPTNEWVFVVGWFDRTRQVVSIQVNDGPIDEAPAGETTRVTDTPFSVGSDALVGSFFDGQLSSVGLFKRTLASAERTSIFGSSMSPYGMQYEQLPDALRSESTSTFVSWWNLSEFAGVRKDSRSTGNDLQPSAVAP